MSKTSNRIAGVLVTLFVACGAGAAFAQSANGGGGGRGGDAGGAGGSATTMPATVWAVVPDNSRQQIRSLAATSYSGPATHNREPNRPNERRSRMDGGGCVGPTEGIHGPRLVGPCGPY